MYTKVVYINLDRRTDRRILIENEFEKMGITNYERFEAIDTSSDFGPLGCLKSHLQVIKMAKYEQIPSILIIEDDFTFLISKEEWEEDMNKLSHVDFDVCMIGYNLIHGIPSSYDFLTKVIDAQTMSAYIINESMYDSLIEVLEKVEPLLLSTRNEGVFACDQIWKSLQPQSNWYCITRRVGKQRADYSDNEKRFVDYNC